MRLSEIWTLLRRAGTAAALCALACAILAADDRPASTADLAQLIRSLDDDAYETRQKSMTGLKRLAADAKHRDAVARAVRAALDDGSTSYETRCRLRRLATALPTVTIAPPRDISDEELDRLIQQLDGDTYAARTGALARLETIVERPGNACRVVERLRPRLRDPTFSRQTRERVQPVWDRAQLVWLSSDPRTWRWPAVEQEQIDRWIELLTRPLPPPVSEGSIQETRARLERKRRLAQREAAHSELLNLLARVDQTGRVKAALDARLAAGHVDDDARQRLAELAGWVRPWLAVEAWTERKLASIVESPLGEEYHAPGAAKPTLFDRLDDRRAHCVSDGVLKPGEYPVDVLFPHPFILRSDTQLVVVNLPTPRTRLAYHYQIKADRDARLPELTERTLNRMAAEKRPLKYTELVMLPSLDAHAVSRFAGQYLQTVGDPPQTDRQRLERAGLGCPHVNLCNMLVEIGTYEAVPGILKAIKAGKLAKPTPRAPENWPWIATLAILASGPGPDGERILADLLDRTDPLVLNSPTPSDVGATAAAILVDLHGIAVEKFGLELADDPRLAEFGGIGYRFNPPEMRQKVRAWWRQQKKP
ncbi:MAG TPA: hypothetical protein VNH11_18500 [Pirellulales bacterium]|nr:hypothetical protein [Pirellulales bacterium]